MLEDKCQIDLRQLSPMKYDDASWHSSGEFPRSSPPEYGATHIALFMRWCFSQGWIGETHRSEEPEDTARMIAGNLPAVEYFLKYCDGKFTDDDLDEMGNEFARKYYGDNGLYLEDYAKHFGKLMYVAPESAHDFKIFSAMIERRLKSGVLTKHDHKSWWKLW